MSMPDLHKFEGWKCDIYPKYWIRKSQEYGLDLYCKGLIALILRNQPKCAFELGIGTGYPFANTLMNKDIRIAGTDISPELIAELKKNFPELNACVGGYEDLNKVKMIVKQKFDLVYCLRSTWYFSDIAAAIDFMLYFAKPRGQLIFDVMNKDSEWNKAMVAKKNRAFILTLVKNVIKFVINIFRPRRYMTDTLFGVREIMYSRDEIEAVLKDRGLAYQIHTLEDIEALGGSEIQKAQAADQRLVWVVQIP